MPSRAAAVQAADDAYTKAVQAAAGGYGTWEAVQVAKHAVHHAITYGTPAPTPAPQEPAA